MRVNRSYTTDTTAGDRKIIFCEGGAESDIAKDLALLMEKDNFIPPTLEDIFEIK